MVHPFDLWQEMWRSLSMHGMPDWSGRVSGHADTGAVEGERKAALSSLATLNKLRVELPTMFLCESASVGASGAVPVIIVAPYALHNAASADFAAGHSIAELLCAEYGGPVALTFWKSASPGMRYFSIDSYLSDLNVAVDEMGGCAALVGLCQGGWLATAYAARFPEKVAALVLAGAPVDIEAEASAISRAVLNTPSVFFENLVGLHGGRVFGQIALQVWLLGLDAKYGAAESLQLTPDEQLIARFEDWIKSVVDLPGVYFLQTVEWLFRENRLARNSFPALGRICNLNAISAPVFVLAASEDEIVAPAQALAADKLFSGTSVTTRVVPGNHLSLFMGRQTLQTVWRDIARWLPQVTRSRRRGPLHVVPDSH